MSPSSSLVTLKTPYRDATAALDAFLAIRKAEGVSPSTLGNYRHTVGLILREHPDFLERPREALLAFVSDADNDWTRFTRLKVLKVFGAFLVEEEILDADPARGIKAPMPRRKINAPSMEAVKAFLNALDGSHFAERRLKVMLFVALDTGLRRGELCGLRKDDFDAEGLLLTVRPETSKTRTGRVVPVSPQTAREIRRFVGLHLAEWRTPWIFPTETGTKLAPSGLGQQIRRASDRTGLKLKIHGLRHLCATEFLRGTGNIVLTAQLLGHTSISTTSRFYKHLTLSDLQAAHGKAAVVSSVLENPRKRSISPKKQPHRR